MKRTIKVNPLDPDSIDKAIEEIEAYEQFVNIVTKKVFGTDITLLLPKIAKAEEHWVKLTSLPPEKLKALFKAV